MKKKSTIKDTRARWQKRVNDAKERYDNFRNNFAPSEPSFYKSGAYRDINRRRKAAITRKQRERKNAPAVKKTKNIKTLTLPFISAFSKKGRVFDVIVKKRADNKPFFGRVEFGRSKRYFRDYSKFRLYVAWVMKKIRKSVAPPKDSDEILSWWVVRGMRDDPDSVSVVYSFLRGDGNADEGDEVEDFFE